MQSIRYERLLAFGLLALCCNARLFAEDATADVDANKPNAPAQQLSSAESSDTSQLQEVTVTATRRAENLENVPIAVTALTANSLQEMGISNTEGLQFVAPGLSMSRQLASASPFIRGVGSANASTPGLEDPVAVYVDGVYYPINDGNVFNFNNIENVQVLKGPQGTLFGRNATGGAIVVTTRDPQVEPEFDGSVSYGNYGTVETSEYATGGKGDVAANIAVYAIHQADGFGKNLVTGDDVGFNRSGSVRTKVEWTPTSADVLLLAFDFGEDHSDIGNVTQIAPGNLGLDLQPPPANPQDTRTDENPFSHGRNWTASVKYSHAFDWGKVSSLSAFRDVTNAYGVSIDATPLNLLFTKTSDFSRSAQEEVLITGTAGRLKWTTGTFIYGADQGLHLNIGDSPIPAINYFQTSIQDTRSYAAYAQGTYAITNDTNITAGARYTSDHRFANGDSVAGVGNSVPPGTVTLLVGNESKTWNSPTWRLAIDHQLSQDIMAYVSYDRGFKSGTYNTSSPQQPAVNPEKLDAYQAGLKSEILNHTLRVNLAGFYYKYRNIQLGSAASNGQNELLNAAAARIDGAELEVQAVPPTAFGHLGITSNVAYLDAVYTSFPNGPIYEPSMAGGNTSTYGNLSGKTAIHSPKWTAATAVSYSLPVGPGDYGVSANYYYSDSFFWDPDDILRQPAYRILNAETYYRFGPEERYRIRIFGNNLTRTAYETFGDGTAFSNLVSYAPPRTYGVGFDCTF